MISYPPGSRVRYQLLGIVFVLVAVLFVAATVAIYRKAFTSSVDVTVRTDRIGTQLTEGADVKVRGVRVGEVRSVAASADGASIELALDPEAVAQVPVNVSAQLLPKTLFGERYVDLRIPDAPARPITSGDVIPEQRGRAAIEVDQVLDHLLPTLRAVQPDDLTSTLHSMSQALRGRGAPLGQTLVALDTYLQGITPAVPQLITVLDQLAPVSDTYAEAAPHLFQGLADLGTTGQTFVERRAELERLFVGVTAAADDLTGFLDRSGDDLVALAGASRPALEVLAKYAPEYPCLFRQLVDGIPRAETVFGKGSAHPERQRITVEVTGGRTKYLPEVDAPRYQDTRGPRCYPQTVPFPQYPPGGPIKDGARKPTAASNQPDPSLGLREPAPATSGGPTTQLGPR